MPLPPVVLKPNLEQEFVVVWNGTMQRDQTAAFELTSGLWKASTLSQQKAFKTSKQVSWVRTLSI